MLISDIHCFVIIITTAVMIIIAVYMCIGKLVT